MELQTNNKKAKYFIMFQVSSHFILSCIPHCSGHTPSKGFRRDTQTDAVISILIFLPDEGQIPDSDGNVSYCSGISHLLLL